MESKEEPNQKKEPPEIWNSISLGDITLESSTEDMGQLMGYFRSFVSDEAIQSYLRILEEKKIKEEIKKLPTYVE